MNDLQVFKSPEFGEIRSVIINDEPMFCLTDVCKALELTQPSKVKDRLSQKGVNTIPTLTAGGMQNLLCSTKQQKGRKTRARDAVGGKAGEVNPEGCDNENISYNALMEIMAIVSERLQADTGFIREFMLSRLDTYEKRITEANRGATEADLQREISRKDKLLDAYLDNLLTKEEYQKKAQALDEHIAELKREVEANKANLEDLVEIQRVRENIDAEVAQYLNENEQLKVEFVLEHLSQVIIYPDKVLVIFDVFGEGVMVEKSQYVSREKRSR